MQRQRFCEPSRSATPYLYNTSLKIQYIIEVPNNLSGTSKFLEPTGRIQKNEAQYKWHGKDIMKTQRFYSRNTRPFAIICSKLQITSC
jgi:hypothetical protein